MRPPPDEIPDQRDEREPDEHGCGICERESTCTSLWPWREEDRGELLQCGRLTVHGRLSDGDGGWERKQRQCEDVPSDGDAAVS